MCRARLSLRRPLPRSSLRSYLPPPLALPRPIETTVSRRRKGKLRASLLLLGLRGGCAHADSRRAAKGSKGQGWGRGEAWRRDSFSRGMLANVLAYKERPSLTGERMRGNKEHQPSLRERTEKGRRAIDRKGCVASSFSRRGVGRRGVLSENRVSDFLFFFFFLPFLSHFFHRSISRYIRLVVKRTLHRVSIERDIRLYLRSKSRVQIATTRYAPEGMISRKEEIAFNRVLRRYYQPVPGAAGTR